MTQDLIKELREATGAGMLDIKQALTEAGNDKDKAVEILRKKGAAKQGKKADRAAKEGIIESYIHPGGRVGALIELNCETDFVARTEDFKNLAKDLALHIAAANPLYVSIDQIPGDVIEKEKEIYKEQMSSGAGSVSGGKAKSEDIMNKIIEGKLAKYQEETCLLEQPFVKDPDSKVKDLLGRATAKLGENVQVKRFSRFVLGN